MMGPVRAVTAVVLGCWLTLSGCGLRTDARPVNIDLIRLDTNGAETTATGLGRVYFVDRANMLRSVQRNAASSQGLIPVLFQGPNDAEAEQGLRSSIPTGTRLLSAQRVGQVLYLDVSRELSEITGDPLIRALAEIVYTATEIDGITEVQIRIDGANFPWPKADRESTTKPLQTYDYPNMVVSAQPDYPAQPISG